MDFSRLIDPEFWVPDRRIYLTWALLGFFGFLSTHVYPAQNALWLWLALVVFGTWTMRNAATVGDDAEGDAEDGAGDDAGFAQQRFFVLWLGLIALGLLVSAAAFEVAALGGMLRYLGVFWLGLLALGHLLTGWWREWIEPYHLTAAAHLVAAGVAFALPEWQYLIAAFVTGGAMLALLSQTPDERG